MKNTTTTTAFRASNYSRAPLRVGMIGCGKISSIYLENCTKRFPGIEIAACADIRSDRAERQAAQYGVSNVCSVDELLSDLSIDAVLNLTIPAAHSEVNEAALEAGKHVFLEKPLGVELDAGRRVVELAEKKGLLLGCAPDTFLGGGGQTCRKIIDEGVIGEPVAATAFMAGHGHESWHPDPAFYYQAGGGPMLDMGPYYLTALVNLIGPAKRIAGRTSRVFDERIATSEARMGERIPVEVPTHQTGTVEFHNGALATVIMSFDIWKHSLPRIEIYGTKGSLSVPDPNSFGGPVMLFLEGDETWREIPVYAFGYTANSRGLGLADMCAAVRDGRPPRASGRLALHVLEMMLAFEQSSNERQFIDIASTCERPAPLSTGLRDGEID